jgi:NTP pyrophosphatase (non-canonical NTP hydrolase)
MQTPQEQARKFREIFELPNKWNRDQFDLQRLLIREEYNEVMVASFSYEGSRGSVQAREDFLKELADLVFVCYQMAEYLGWDLDEALHRVFISNMSKVGEDGKVMRREDGKVLKGPNYKPPTLIDLVK